MLPMSVPVNRSQSPVLTPNLPVFALNFYRKRLINQTIVIIIINNSYNVIINSGIFKLAISSNNLSKNQGSTLNFRYRKTYCFLTSLFWHRAKWMNFGSSENLLEQICGDTLQITVKFRKFILLYFYFILKYKDRHFALPTDSFIGRLREKNVTGFSPRVQNCWLALFESANYNIDYIYSSLYYIVSIIQIV